MHGQEWTNKTRRGSERVGSHDRKCSETDVYSHSPKQFGVGSAVVEQVDVQGPDKEYRSDYTSYHSGLADIQDV
jgi:hypothetical protein